MRVRRHSAEPQVLARTTPSSAPIEIPIGHSIVISSPSRESGIFIYCARLASGHLVIAFSRYSSRSCPHPSGRPVAPSCRINHSSQSASQDLAAIGSNPALPPLSHWPEPLDCTCHGHCCVGKAWCSPPETEASAAAIATDHRQWSQLIQFFSVTFVICQKTSIRPEAASGLCHSESQWCRWRCFAIKQSPAS